MAYAGPVSERLPGEVLGRYTLLHRLGRGGVGEVWASELRGLRGFRKPVALKLLRPERVGPELEAALVREAHLGALIQHPNVVGVYELDHAGEVWFMAMELVRGCSAAALARGAPMHPFAAVELVLQACAGLEHVHHLQLDGRPARVVHRDIKPGNLLIDTFGRVKVADLGLASFGDATGLAAGTPGYMPPEQREGRAQDHRVDLYALGATLWSLLTGLRPTSLGAAGTPSLGPLADVVARCLEPDPDRRFPDAASLAAALSALRPPTGPALAELVARATSDAPHTVVPVESEAPTRVAAKGNVPASEDVFVGRSAALVGLIEQLRRPGVVSLTGSGGVGKTRLGLEVARRLERELAGGAWWIDLSDARDTASALRAVAQGLGVLLDTGDAGAAVAGALGRLGRCLVVLDGVDRVDLAPLLDRWRSAAPQAALLTTSRAAGRIAGPTVPVAPLSPAEATALFLDRCPSRPPDDEAALVSALVLALEGLPLAIELAAMRTASWTLRQVHDRHVVAGSAGLARVLAEAWARATPGAQLAWSQLPVFAGGFTVEAAEAVLTLDGSFVIGALQELTEAGLVTYDRVRHRFSAPASVLEWAEQHPPSAADRAACEGRHVAWFAQLGGREALVALAGADGAARFRRLADEAANLELACQRAAASGQAGAAAELALAANTVYLERGPIAAALPLLEGALRAGSPPHQPRLTVAYGRILAELGRSDEAVAAFRKAEALAPGTGTAARAGCALATQLRLAGRADEALAQARGSAALAGALGERSVESDAVHWVGVLELAAGRRQEGLAALLRSLDLARQAGDVVLEATTLGGLGSCYLELGRVAESRAHTLAALAAWRRLERPRREAESLVNLANLDSNLGRFAEARASFQAAQALCHTVGYRRLEAVVLGNLGLLGTREDGRADAVTSYLASLELHREVGNRQAEASVATNLGIHHVLTGSLAEGRRWLDHALAANEAVGGRSQVAWALVGLGVLEAREGRVAEAFVAQRRALALARELHARWIVARALVELAALERGAGRLADAAPLVAEAERTARRLDAQDLLVEVLCERALHERDQGRADAAAATLAEAERLAEALPARSWLVDVALDRARGRT